MPSAGKPGNARTNLDTRHVDGVLIGGARLLAANFDAIIDFARGHAPAASGLEHPE